MFVLFLFLSLIVDCGLGFEVPGYIQDELNKAACLVNCTDFENTNCNCGMAKVWTTNRDNHLDEPLLHCREDSMLVFKMPNENFVYLLEYKSKLDDIWYIIKTSRHSIIKVDHLEDDTEYKIRVWGISKDKDLFGPVESGWVKTLENDYSPQVVSSLWLKNLSMINDDYTAIINWNPSADLSCYYEFVWFGGDDMSDYTQKEIREPSTLYELKIGGLMYDGNYSVAVMTKSSDWRRESEKTWLHFSTQPCLAIYANLNICQPARPTGLQLEYFEVSNLIDGKHKVYNVVVSWDKPKFQPEGYVGVFRSIIYKTNNSVSYKNITGDLTKLIFENVDLGAHFQISLTAWSPGGSSPPAVIYQESYLEELGDRTILMSLIGTIVIILVVLLIIVIGFMWRKKIHVEQEDFIQEIELKSLYPNAMYIESDSVLVKNFNDEWEVNYCDLHLLSILGRGAFGIVKKAVLLKGGTKMQVAVKMLKDESNGDDVCQFNQEIEILKSVGRHPHIVSIIGCCTKGPVGPLLVVEYCGKGDLLTYLRNICENMNYGFCEAENALTDLEAEASAMNFSNKSYHIIGNNSKIEVLEMKDLLSIGRQVATGMEYLSSVRVVHRDLAARNVLVCDDNTVKVSDFGLSRDVYKDNVYCKLGGGKLPLRWMAIESLTHQRYTTKSDVWSFGILIWEIFTLGGNPYPNIEDTHKLLESLKAGERMSRPDNCSQETYTLMLNCWKENPKERPSFGEIRCYLEGLLENTIDYLNLNDFASELQDFKDNSETVSIENHYVL